MSYLNNKTCCHAKAKTSLHFIIAGPGKEWKLKPTNNNIVQVSATSAVGSSDVSTESAEVDTQLQPSDVDIEIKKGTFELQQKLEKSRISDVQPVIIPNHLHVPEAEKLGFCFGTFEASLGLGVSANNTAESEKTPSLSGASESTEEMTNEQFLRSVIFTSCFPKLACDLQKLLGCSPFSLGIKDLDEYYQYISPVYFN